MSARRALMALAGFGGMVLISSTLMAQYPGSAGDLNDGAFSAAPSASSGSSASSASSPSSSAASSSDDASRQSSMSASKAGYGSARDGNASKGYDSNGNQNDVAFLPKKSMRERALIRQFRLEFVKTLTFETANNRPFHALSAGVYLDQFLNELDAGLEQKTDLNSLGRDLSLVRDALDDRLDALIVSYSDNAPRRSVFPKKVSAGGSATALRAEIQKLKLKHELLAFGEYSLQAMGHFAK